MQDFVEVETRHFVVTSSLESEETLALARSLEFFHAGVLALLGLPDESPEAVPAQVYFFDDRSLGRPFAVQNEAAFLIDAVEAPILVFRGGRDFAARATPELRQRYARRVLRDQARSERPLWYEEGVARLAGSMTETRTGVQVGRLIGAYQETLLDWRRDDLADVLIESDVSDETAPQRARFAAACWAIAHTLEFERKPGDTERGTLLAAYRRALDAAESVTPTQAFEAIGLSREDLVRRVYDQMEKPRGAVRKLEARGFDPRKLSVVPLSRAEGRARLGELALRLGRPELAREYFERALASDAKSQRAQLGLAESFARLGDPDRAAALLAESPVGPLAPVAVAIAAGDAERALAAASDEGSGRSAALEAARAAYARGLAGDAPSARAQFGMALLSLEVAGGDPAEAIRWIEAARATRRGSLALELERARAEARSGEERTAELRARNVVSRAQDHALTTGARALLESLEGRAR